MPNLNFPLQGALKYWHVIPTGALKKEKKREKVFKDSRRYFQRYYGRIFINNHFVTRPKG
jgi:hypothetical protein